MIEWQNVKGFIKAKSCSYGLLVFSVIANKLVCGAVMGKLRFSFALKLRDDALRQDLAQLDTPLIEGINVPDHALRETECS